MENISLYFKEISNSTNMCLIENDLVSDYIAANNIWEPHLHFFYSNFIKKDFIIIDGGANIGSHTINFAKLAYEGKTYAFEPQNIIFNVLSTNILINGLSDIVCQYRLGLGDSMSYLNLSPIEEQYFGNSMINWGGRGLLQESAEDGDVQIITIDSLNLSKLDLIKLDVQGMERKTIDGGNNSINKFKPILIIEAGISSASKFFRENGPVLSSNNVELFDLLKGWGYMPFQISSDKNYFFGDTIFLHEDKHKAEIDFIRTQKLYNYLN